MAILCAAGAQAATDSSLTLFQASQVANYRIEFYSDTWKSQLEAMWAIDSGYLPARFSDGQTVLDSVGIRYKGNSSYTLAGNNPKKPLKIKFNEFKSQTYYGVKILNFSNGVGDPSFLREKLAYDIASHYLPTPRANFANIRIADQNLGLYTQVEQADKLFLKRWYANAGGNLFKAGDDGAALTWIADSAGAYKASGDYELKTNETLDDWSGLARLVAALDHDGTEADFCAQSSRWIDPDNLTKYLAFNMVLSNFDSYTGSGRNYYLYQVPDSGTMQILPWDMNLAFGGYSNGWNVLNQDLVNLSNTADHPLMRQMLACEDLRQRYLGWTSQMIAQFASTDSIQSAIDRLAPLIRAHVAADSNKFYSTAAFEANLTTAWKPSPSTSIPGLVGFSRTRNANLATQLAGLGIHNAALLPHLPGLQISRQGRRWIATAPASLGDFTIDQCGVDGRIQAPTQTAHDGTLVLDLATGITRLRLTWSGGTNTYTVANF